jgi:catechol 2,3-dioxygenase-like lactoylglutathione lyase family enzyme
MMATIQGIHHVKVPVTVLATSREFYEGLLGFAVLREFPDADGVVRGVAYQPVGGVSLALREDPERAVAMAGYDLIAFAVEPAAGIDTWVAHLDSLGIEHSDPVPGAMGTVVGLDDPDHLKIVLYASPQ